MAEGITLPTRAHDTPLARAWAFGWAEDPNAGATLSYIVVTRDVTLYAVWRDVELRFWWGTYIPEGSWAAFAFFTEFDLQELVDTREKSRRNGNDEAMGSIY